MAVAEGVVERGLRLDGVGGGDPRDGEVADDIIEVAEADLERLVDEVGAVAVEDVEEADQQRRGRPRGRIAAERAHRVLEGLGGRVLVDAEHLAVEHHRRHG